VRGAAGIGKLFQHDVDRDEEDLVVPLLIERGDY